MDLAEGYLMKKILYHGEILEFINFIKNIQ